MITTDGSKQQIKSCFFSNKKENKRRDW